MLHVAIKPLLECLNSNCGENLREAANRCVNRGHYEVTVEHFLLQSLTRPEEDISLLLHHFSLDTARLQSKLIQTLETFKGGNSGRPVFSPLLLELLQDAWLLCSVELGLRQIRSGAVFLILCERLTFYTASDYTDLLENVSRETLRKDFFQLLQSSPENNQTTATESHDPVVTGSGFLEKYCQDFTNQARAGLIDPVFGREDEIAQVVDVLARRRKNNPILVGEPGVGKTAVIEGLALRIVEGDVPEMLQKVRLLGLDLGALEAGAGMKGEFENRLKGVITEVKASDVPIILFIDEAHTLVGSGGQAGGSDAANLLKPALARGELRTCAATTWSEYKKYFEKDPALARRFQLIKLPEPDVETATLILRGLKGGYEKAHDVTVLDSAVVAAASFADRYISGRFLPDKAIDLLDTACARVKINLAAKPAALNRNEKTIKALKRQQTALLRDQAQGEIIDVMVLQQCEEELEKLTNLHQELTQRWQEQLIVAKQICACRQQLYKALDAEAEKPEASPSSNDNNNNNGSDNDNETADAEALRQQLHQLTTQLAELQQEQALIQVEVNTDMIGQVVSDWTGIPVGKIQRDQAAMVMRLQSLLQERIKGQEQAIAGMVEVIKATKSGLTDPCQPQGVFLLVGPSGVGKTETGLALADLLFGGEQNIVTINMSEFQEKHTTSRLIGSPPGYVGYGEGGMLTEAVRRNPYSVVLLDEVEKAHPEVLNLFYQVFDKGSLTDGEGKEINFSNTLIILTSNLASAEIQQLTAGQDNFDLEQVTSSIRPLLTQYFKPALLARMTILPYVSLKAAAMERIVRLKLGKLQQRLQDNNRVALQFSDSVVDEIRQRCTEVETGARNIDYILKGKVMPQISQRILEALGSGDLPKRIELQTAEDGQFIIQFSDEAAED